VRLVGVQEAEIGGLREVFEKIDIDRNGIITIDELQVRAIPSNLVCGMSF
jgi:Ca2+-binding EF-hand superfamily protein